MEIPGIYETAGKASLFSTPFVLILFDFFNSNN